MIWIIGVIGGGPMSSGSKISETILHRHTAAASPAKNGCPPHRQSRHLPVSAATDKNKRGGAGWDGRERKRMNMRRTP
ncbi:hypothetical protein MRX96_028619 [Rhipicephalus microplus]